MSQLGPLALMLLIKHSNSIRGNNFLSVVINYPFLFLNKNSIIALNSAKPSENA